MNDSPIQYGRKHYLQDRFQCYVLFPKDSPFPPVIQNTRQYLSSGELTTLHHGGILFLEALSQSSGTLEVFVDTAKDTTLLSGDQGLGGEVVDTVVEAALYEAGVHLCKVKCVSCSSSRGITI
jgi:hypothetical protein